MTEMNLNTTNTAEEACADTVAAENSTGEKGTEHCSQCSKHCPVTALKCGRGREFFGLTKEQSGEGRDEQGDHEHHHGHGEDSGHEHGHRHGRGQEGRESRGHGHWHGGEEEGREHGHGRRHGGEESREGRGNERAFSGEAEGLYGLMRACGHQLYHGSESQDLFGALDEAEQAELTRLLGKLIEDWKTK